ncbi:MAG: ABC transporter ATP-binding protein [Negativicutes bacterium]
MPEITNENILEIKNLTTAFLYDGKHVPVTSDVSFNVRKGEILGIVGESGSGKSVTVKTVLRLIPTPPSSVLGGEIFFEGRDLLKTGESEMRGIRGNKISMIFQEPMTSLNPVYTCGNQIIEAIMLHQKLSKRDALEKAKEMLELVGMSMPERRLKNYPHELSGGMRQRVMIAMALCCKPKLLIADEPTTALDPTIQAQILELIKELQSKMGMSVLYITHDFGVVAAICDRVVVMYAGMVMEVASVQDLFAHTLHPYTLGLMQAMPRINQRMEFLYNIKGMVPHITRMPPGCRFEPRCPYETEECKKACPDMVDAGRGHLVRCFHYKKLINGGISNGCVN